MSRISWFKSMFFPILSIIVSAIILIGFLSELRFSEVAFTAIFGVVCGGIVPLFLIMFFKIDISKYFVGKMILFAVLAILVVPSWILFVYMGGGSLGIFILPIVILIAETNFSAIKDEDFKTKLCLVLSSLVHVYSGFLIDFVRSFANPS